ncbi:hypothetical protein XM38_044300 [Halomicronema hongdechloris C2206]|uniref:Uncharacterized protein n=1 Tax=Halomicronema hongdechloris C2206 TaxID=1641165 RepID=A0A1Z3HT29_9CYAN|nr:hypothetical protein [Halomicronema hongdechloris]ASC73463.1 hypothetical protein XM38_044300 [Halomicronema hongdechloris C2206]
MAKSDPAVLKSVTVSLPFGIGSAAWEADPTERNAAWELYIELVTRVAVQSLATEVGTVREAMNSLYSLFGSTREILRKAGPQVGASKDSVGGIAIAVLNNGLRPFLSKWHPLLQAWEVKKPADLSPQAHEKAWEQEPVLRQELEALRRDLEQYADALADIAGVQHD